VVAGAGASVAAITSEEAQMGNKGECVIYLYIFIISIKLKSYNLFYDDRDIHNSASN